MAAQLQEHPRTSEGAFWHKLRYPHQLWLDGVYMGMPFLAAVGEVEGDSEMQEEAVREFSIARSHLRDSETGLYYHAWDEAKQQEWADPDTGRSPHFWARGLGWYAMALVDILDVIPAEQTALREPLLGIISELAESLLKTQDETGTWFQVMDMPDEPGNYREASGSAMFTYFLAIALNRARRYRPDLLPKKNGPILEPDIYERTGLFAPGVPHRITVIKQGNEIFMMIRNPDKQYLSHWVNADQPPVTEGRIGLRHMYTRSARYRDFRVSVHK